MDDIPIALADLPANIAILLRSCVSGILESAALGDRAVPLDFGRPINVGSINGRSRIYSISGSQRGNKTVISIAFNQPCDMVAATALIQGGGSASIEPAVLDFLNSLTILKWTETALGL
ncbi:hypothetical protein [Bradyrhizobium sp. sBnM-33]|uniref:hypothetical protein n=1 Tax=Bradyrhizobium sp. sBnM-33 TaxID=2831780 RepID=UPI001BD1A585|nr:hypothetical protein [Bradyrhizobium sp. sBnM-33]WOH53943.1 hypothetical protein RX328_18735 [Bradyrhizobium sp. sBnM-33]